MRALPAAAIAAAAVAAACASPRPESHARIPQAPALLWDPASGVLSCHSGEAELTVPPELRDQVQLNPDDEAMIVLPQAHSALSISLSGFPRLTELGGLLGDMPRLWARLHEKASGDDLRRGDVHVDAEMRDGRYVANYTMDVQSVDPKAKPPADDAPARNRKWRLVYIEAGRCRFTAVACTDLDDKPLLITVLDTLRTSPNLLVDGPRGPR